MWQCGNQTREFRHIAIFKSTCRRQKTNFETRPLVPLVPKARHTLTVCKATKGNRVFKYMCVCEFIKLMYIKKCSKQHTNLSTLTFCPFQKKLYAEIYFENIE